MMLRELRAGSLIALFSIRKDGTTTATLPRLFRLVSKHSDAGASGEICAFRAWDGSAWLLDLRRTSDGAYYMFKRHS